MFRYKYELLKFIPRDYRSYQQHFHKMALQGYLVEDMTFAYVKYRKDQPQTMYYCFDKTEHIDQLEGENSKENQEYKTFIEESGWKHICKVGQYHLFSNTNNAKPLHSDEAFHYSLMKDKSNSVILTIALLVMVLMLISIEISRFGYQFLFSDFYLNRTFYYLIMAFTYCLWTYYDYQSSKEFKKAIEIGQLPHLRSIEDIKRYTYLDILKVVPLLLMFTSVSTILSGILIFIVFIMMIVIGKKILKSKNNYVTNAIFMTFLFVSILPAIYLMVSYTTGDMKVLEAKDVFGTSLKAPNRFEYDQSILTGSYHSVLEVALDENEELYFMDIIYIKSQLVFLTDLVFNHMLDSHEYQSISYENVSEAYINETEGILLVRENNQILRFNYDDKTMFDIDEIINHCFQ